MRFRLSEPDVSLFGRAFETIGDGFLVPARVGTPRLRSSDFGSKDWCRGRSFKLSEASVKTKGSAFTTPESICRCSPAHYHPKAVWFLDAHRSDIENVKHWSRSLPSTLRLPATNALTYNRQARNRWHGPRDHSNEILAPHKSTRPAMDHERIDHRDQRRALDATTRIRLR